MSQKNHVQILNQFWFDWGDLTVTVVLLKQSREVRITCSNLGSTFHASQPHFLTSLGWFDRNGIENFMFLQTNQDAISA
jgi:hypothetical protein